MFKDNLNRICREKGTSPTRLVLNMGYSTSKVAAWNRGNLPKEEMMHKLAAQLNCTVADFFTEPTEMPSAKDIPLNDDERDMLAIYRALSRKDRHRLMSAVYAFEGEGRED